MHSFLFRELQTNYSFTFNLRFLYELKRKVRLSESVCGIFHFQFRFVFIEVYIFVLQKQRTLRGHNFFQNQNNSKATHTFPSRSLIFELQQEVF